ncbi:TonB-dependent receptor [Alteromonadales bacterium alter-6D02]|nr:TonB-dependent receptor [Alteromonadales bacterium alter-6D02]
MISVLGSHSVFAKQAPQKSKSDTEMIVVVGQATSGLDNLINQQDIENIQANDLGDLFRQDSTISVGGSVGMGQKLYLRNVGEDLLNISIDGAAQAGTVFHHSGRVNIEPELLKQVEIEAGTGSATAGPGALGGSVLFITKDPSDLLAPQQTLGALIKTSYYGNGEGFKNTATVYARDNNEVISGMLSVTDSDLGNVEDGNGHEILGTESEKTLGYAKIKLNISPEQTLSLSHENIEEQGDILYKPELIASKRNVPEPTTGSRATTIINYSYDVLDSDYISIDVNAYDTEQEQIREFRGIAYDGGRKSTGLTLKNTSTFAQHDLIVGLDYRDDTSFLNDVDFANAHFSETGKVAGLFVQNISQLTDQLTLSSGVRFDQYKLDDTNGLSLDDQGFSPNASINVTLSQQWSVSAGYAEALRGPEVKDSFKLSSASNDPTLKAEQAKNIELGVDYNLEQFNFAAGIYRTTIENPVGGETPWSKVYQNLKHDIKTDGLFLTANYTSDNLTLSANYHNAESTMNDELVTRYVYSSAGVSTGDKLSLNANYQLHDALSIGWNGQFVQGIDTINITVAGDNLTTVKPGYAVHDLYARWTPFSEQKLTLNIAIKNLFDKQYLDHASMEDLEHNPGYSGIIGAPEMGRDLRVSLAYQF